MRRRPKLGASLVVAGDESEAGDLTSILSFVVHVEAADHRPFVHVRQAVNSPWDTSDFGTDLGDQFADDGPEVFAVVYRASEDHLGNDWDFLHKKAL